MNQKKHSYINTFWYLLKTDLYIYKNVILNSFIDATIWFSSTIILFAYVFPKIGMQQGFGVLIAISSIVSCAFWDIWMTSTTFVSDINGNKTINYFLTLPIPNYIVFIKQILGYAIKAAVPAIIILPLGKLFLWQQMSFAHFSLSKFIFIYVLLNIFLGAFSLFIASTIQDLNHLGKVGIRFLFPLWSFSGAFYSWRLLYSSWPSLGYVNLLNPLLYAMEGIKVAILGQANFINYWICIGMILLFTVIFTGLAIRRLKRRLDFV